MAGNFLMNLLGLGGGQATMDAARDNYGEINRSGNRGQDFITEGGNQARGYLERGYDQYAPLAGATGTYADALGLNGSAGNGRASEAFQAGPGYQFAVDQGLDALGRRASSLGRYQSGGTETDFMQFGQGMANQEYGGWLNRLMGASDTALQGQGGALNNLANLSTGQADARLNLDQAVTGARVSNNNMYAQGGEQQAAGQAALGGNLMNLAGRAFGFGGFGGF